ncbi:hypothetical protein L3X38_029617 [Prunus dulcis]|uniref:Uncharacterized protein n=1 Tax=Prunus dulcis TaxID=3755 RepID=A0AAD4Z2L6_PRUDU|nr:hypothetical protein L3X38_029617 [Prunus dulcis]
MVDADRRRFFICTKAGGKQCRGIWMTGGSQGMSGSWKRTSLSQVYLISLHLSSHDMKGYLQVLAQFLLSNTYSAVEEYVLICVLHKAYKEGTRMIINGNYLSLWEPWTALKIP